MDKKLLLLLLLLYFPFAVEARVKLKIVTTNYPPYQMKRGNEVVGMSAEIVKAILKKAEMKASYTVYPWARAYMIAQKEKNVLIHNISRTKKREKLFHWIGSITPNNVYLWKLRSRKDIVINDIKSAGQYTFGVLKNDVKRHYLLEQGIHKDHVTIVVRDELNFRKLIFGRIDLMPYDEMAFLYKLKQFGYDPIIAQRSLHLKEISGEAWLAASKLTDEKIVEKLILALESIKKDGIPEQIRESYLHQKKM